MTKRQVNIATVAVAFVLVPPLLTRLSPRLPTWLAFSDGRAQLVAYAVCFAAVALSLNLLMGYAGQISLGQAALFGVGAFTSSLVTTRGFHLHMIFGVIAGGMVTGFFAFLLGLPALRLRGLYLAIITVAFGVVMENSLLRWRPLTGGSAGVQLFRPRIFGFELAEQGDYLVLVLLVFLGIWLLDVNVVRTKLGRAFKALKEDEAVAQAFGIDVSRYKLLAFVLSGVMAGVAGSMFGHLTGIVNNEAFPYRMSLSLVVMVVVGGLGSRVWVTVAAIFFTLLQRFFALEALRFFKGWELVLGGALLVFTMARNPGGLAGGFREAREKREIKLARAGTEGKEDEVMPKLPSLPRPTGLPERPHVGAGGSVLEVKDITVTFGGLVAVDGVSLKVPQGQIVGLIGPNGAGKTTTFNCISGFIRPDGGRVEFLGNEIQSLPPHERVRLGIGRTFQLIGLAKELTVKENFLLAQHVVANYGTLPALGFLRSVQTVESELEARSLQAIGALGFERFTDTPVRHLSHGQKRLVELGCALVTAPELLLLDEPSAGMAPGAVENLATRLRDIRDELGRTVLLVEHNIPLVLDVCDYIYVLNFGQVLAHGTTEEIASHPEVIAAYFGEAPAEEVTT